MVKRTSKQSHLRPIEYGCLRNSTREKLTFHTDMWISFRNKFSLSLRNSHQKNSKLINEKKKWTMTQKLYPVNDEYLPLRSILRCRTEVKANL